MGVEQLVACSVVVSGWKLFAFLFKLYIPLCSCEILFINYMLCFSGTYKFLLLFCSQEKLRSIASYLNLVPPSDKTVVEDWFRFDRDFLLELLVWSLLQAADIYISVHLLLYL